ncbi:MAG: nucleoside kinase, partial [Firmicutes bacterium]|nr:nucleoside kinase [Bacillota bacterium]
KMADEVFNSSQPYELSVLKKRALPLLVTEPGSKFEAEAKRLRALFDQIDTIEDESLIEADSVIREFIGGGSL